MALSANTARSYDLGDINTFGVKASSTIYEGSAVGSSGGYARALAAGDDFLGFALEKVVGGSGDGDVNIEVKTRGQVQLSVTSVAVTDIGKTVWASDDGTFALTSNGGANSKVGVVHRFISSGVAIVAFDASQVATATGITELTVADGVGTNDGTIGAITADASVIAAVQELAAKINEILRSNA